MVSTMLMFPNSATSLILGGGLLNEDHNLYLYLPRDVHKRMAFTTPLDLHMYTFGRDVEVHEVATLDNLNSMKFIIFPFLDVLPEKERVDFATMCGQLFRYH